jgi:cardiolipin synthase C
MARTRETDVRRNSGASRALRLFAGLGAVLATTLVALPAATAGRVAELPPAMSAGASGELLRAAVPSAPGTAAVGLIDSGLEALRLRDSLIDVARQRIDAQYYIWQADVSGRYLALRLLAAAERGVRVRVLLDDANLDGRDKVLAALAAHPNVDIRIFNPAPARQGAGRYLAFVREFGRLNRRMHNKSFTVDGEASIVGGRNIGDEYFDLHPALNFRDRELLVVGPVVAELSAAFAGFWDSAATRPIEALAAKPLPVTLAATDLAPASTAATAAVRAAGYQPPAAGEAYLRERVLPFLEPAPVTVIADPPPRPDAPADSAQPVAVALRGLFMAARSEIVVESAYLILGDAALADAASLTERGVRIRALTNSLASNDLATNHSGYARRRRAMLDSGIELHELRPDATACRRLVAVSARCHDGGIFSLHAKSAVIDHRRVYVGSFNVNLRSAYLNSETALIVDSPVLAARVASSIAELMAPDSSFLVQRAPGGRVEWTTVQDGVARSFRREPMTGFWRRAEAGFYALFPLEKYL